MTEKERELHTLIKGIGPVSDKAKNEVRKKWNEIAHPLHSLGNLEEVVITIGGVEHKTRVEKRKKALIIMCADNGVVEEGVTQTGQEVTAIVAENFLTEKATAAIMAKETNTDLFPIDIGIKRDTTIINKKISYGTKNMTKGPAMEREEAVRALLTGIEFVGELKEKGYNLIATGEMGIGNTTTSSGVTAVLLGKSPALVTGKGAGLSALGLQKKIGAISTAIEKNQPDKKDVIDVLSKVGGLDIAGLAGVFLGGALYQVPIVIDGFITLAAALCAVRLSPVTREYCIASHLSKEPATEALLEELALSPSLNCKMSLGEGTGALAFFPLIDLGIEVYERMSTFKDNEITQYEELN